MDLAVRDRQLTLRVGAVSLVALSALVALLVAFDGCGRASGFRATVYFDNAGGLREGAEVRVAGQKIGQVMAISFVPQARLRAGASDERGRGSGAEGSRHPLYGTGGIAAIIEIEHRRAHMAPIDGEYFIAARGLLGERYIAIGPPRGPGAEARADAGRDAVGRPLAAGDEVRGIDPPIMDRVWNRTYRNILAVRGFLDDVRPEGRAFATALSELFETLSSLEAEPGAMEGARERVSAVVAEARQLYDTWSSGEITGADLKALVARARVTLDAGRASLAELRPLLQILAAEVARLRAQALPEETRQRLTRAIARSETMLAVMEQIIAEGEELLAMVARGEGTVGGLLNDPEFPEDAKQLGRIIKRRPWRVIGRGRRE